MGAVKSAGEDFGKTEVKAQLFPPSTCLRLDLTILYIHFAGFPSIPFPCNVSFLLSNLGPCVLSFSSLMSPPPPS